MDKLHSVEKIRPVKTSSNLWFGVAIDKALNALLLKTEDPKDVFRNEFLWSKLQNVEWDKKDLQLHVFNEQELELLKEHPEDYKIYACLLRKGTVMLEVYQEYMLPYITEVHSVQKNLNSRPGILDAILTIDGNDHVLVDHKTARRPYPADFVQTDTQIALYGADQELDTGAFIVLCKTFRFIKTCTKCEADGSTTSHQTCSQDIMGSRCHGTFTREIDRSKILQLVIDKIPQENKEEIVKNITEVENKIERGIFEKNYGSCANQYGRPCQYFDYCHNGIKDGLETKKEEK
jgi:hypothetical protein